MTRFFVQRSRVSSRAPSTPSERLRGREFERAADTGRLIGERDAALELLWERFLDQARTEPRCCGTCTRGPSASLHVSLSVLPARSTGSQITDRRPALLDSAPYFAALVASSCSASES